MTATRSDPVGAAMAALTTTAGRLDPYRYYAELRALGPTVLAPDGALVVTGYRACSQLLRDHRLSKSPGRVLAAAGHADWEQRPSLRMMFGSILMLNPPEHTRLRAAVASVFTARRVAALAPAVETIVTDLLDRVEGETDFVASFAFPLPVTVIGELLGIPAADRAQFEQLVHDWAAVLDLLTPLAVDRADVAAGEIAGYLDGLAAERRRHPADDLISALVQQQDGAGVMSGEELVTLAALLLAAGFETTTGLLSNGLLALLAHQAQLAWLRDHPDAADTATTELLRYDSPVQMLFGRTASAPVELGWTTLGTGQRVIALLGAANRDPEVFTEPDALRLDRAEAAPLSFGGGIHYCLGAPLARLEASLAFRGLLQRFSRIELAGEPVHRDGLVLHGHTSLPLRAY